MSSRIPENTRVEKMGPSNILEQPTPQGGASLGARAGSASARWRYGAFWASIAGICLGLCIPLTALVRAALASDINSHILLIPFVSAYLIHLGKSSLPSPGRAAPAWAVLAALIGIASLIGYFHWHAGIDEPDRLGFAAAACVAFVWTAGFLWLGAAWMASVAFPMIFLAFMIPLPGCVVNSLEMASQSASAEAASFFFNITNTPVLRQGNFFQIPGITIEVAQECSGIHSSWVLFLTSLIGSHMFLRSNLRRAALVAFVIPLGILRNGFRILVIGLLCIHISPRMIDSPIHHRGGPIFFMLSLVPFFALLLWLRKSDQKQLRKARQAGLASRG